MYKLPTSLENFHEREFFSFAYPCPLREEKIDAQRISKVEFPHGVSRK